MYYYIFQDLTDQYAPLQKHQRKTEDIVGQRWFVPVKGCYFV